MRIVAVADTHLYEADLGVLPDGDVLVHAGDMLRFGTFEELEPFAEWFRRQPHAEKLVVAGNHDWCFQRQREEAELMLGSEVRYLQDSGTEFGGLKWWGSPWQPAFRDWAFNLPRGEALRACWASIPPDTDILVTHCPPSGHGDRTPIEGRTGCEDLLQRVLEVQPRLHIFGHIHQDGGLWRIGDTVAVNVTTWEGDRAPTVIDLDGDGVHPVHVPPAGD